MTVSALDMETVCNMSAPVNSSVLPRWERKALQASKPTGDRFIASRSGMDMDMANFKVNQTEQVSENAEFQKTLKSSLLNGAEDNARVLAFRNKAPTPAAHQNDLKVLYSQNKVSSKTTIRAKCSRVIADAPTRILDAPDMVDDYYLNLLDWSANNTLAVALGQVVYLWDAASGEINELMSVDGANDHITSVSWIGEGGGHLAVGTNSCDVQLWDTGSQKQVRSMGGHEGRVGALDWNQHILSSGSRDGTIINHDVRIRDHCTATLASHTQEVCGLKWNREGTMLASGGNDNLLCLWDAGAQGRTAAKHQLTGHNAAVKALAWSPHERNLLATGGGTADRCMKFWNTQNGACLNTIDTGSQVCSLLWSPTEKEILASSGFGQNSLSLYNYPSMQKTKELTGHTARVLHMAASPNGTTVCSAAADETLRFWDIFAEMKTKGKSPCSSTTLSSMRSIR